MTPEVCSLEDILQRVRDDGNASKELNGIFVDILQSLGISPGALQNNNGRYIFAGEDCDFIYRILSHYTEQPFVNIRKHRFQDVDPIVLRANVWRFKALYGTFWKIL